MNGELIIALEDMMKRLRGDGLVAVRVTSIDMNQFLFDAEDGAGNTYLEVRMNATTGQSGLILVPVVKSTVLVTDLGNQGQEWVMVAAGDVSEIYLKGPGPLVQSGVLGESLNTNLSQLLAALSTLAIALTAFSVANQAVTTVLFPPLAPAYTALSAALGPVQTSISAVSNQLTNHLSKDVKLT